MTKPLIPDFQSILRVLDLDKVHEAILTDPRTGEPVVYAEEDLDNIKDMIWTAAEKWLPRDLVEFDITGIEEKFEGPLGTEIVKGYFDITGRLRGMFSPYNSYPGKNFVLDWKTSGGELDTRWKNRLLDSWQWKLYANNSKADIFIYRGVSRRCDSTGCLTRDVVLETPRTISTEVEEYGLALIGQRNFLIDNGFEVWPRNMPNACMKYNRLCPFKDDCDSYSMPRFVPPKGKVMSYTEFDRFMLCPEKSRRLQLEGKVEDEDEELKIGSGFHAGIAEVYRQAREFKI